MAKVVFSLLADEEFNFRNIVLDDFKSNEEIVNFVRYYAQFYDRTGHNSSYAASSQIMLVSESGFVLLSGRYIGLPLYDYSVFSGGGFVEATLRLSLEKIGIRTTKESLDNNEKLYSEEERNNPHYFDNVKVLLKDEEKVEKWKYDLNNVMNTEFSDSEKVGTLIKNCVTHMQVSNWHMNTFYQVDHILTNAYWSEMFGFWFAQQIEDKFAQQTKGRKLSETKRIVLCGYEHLSEATLLCTKKFLEEKHIKCECIVYDAGYHSTAHELIPHRIQYVTDEAKTRDSLKDEKTQIAFLMTISTTGGSFKKMRELIVDELVKELKSEKENEAIEAILEEKIKAIRKKWRWSDFGENIEKDSCSKIFGLFTVFQTFDRDKPDVKNIEQVSLQKINVHWEKPINCQYCYPGGKKYERALYTTDDSSLIPTMMLFPFSGEREAEETVDFESLDFFEKDKNGYIYADSLLYKHISWQDSHYLYYIRTEELLSKIIKNNKFGEISSKIRKKLKREEGVDIIVAPSHNGNQYFPLELNNKVFDGKAHIISFNAQKTFRSNFEAEYANIATLVKKYKEKLNFYFVDDQINTGVTFRRTQSFLRNLYNKEEAGNFDFSGIITLINRKSSASNRDFIDEKKRYSIFNFNVPAIRTSGDSCFLCKQQVMYQNLEKVAALDSTAGLIFKKVEKSQVQEVSKFISWSQSKKSDEKDEQNVTKEDKQRYMRRYEAEDLLWKTVRGFSEIYKKDKVNEIDFLNKVSLGIFNRIDETLKNKAWKEKIEYLIAFFKVLSRPFLSYRPFVTTAVINLLRQFCDKLIKESIKETKNLTIEFSNLKFSAGKEDKGIVKVDNKKVLSIECSFEDKNDVEFIKKLLLVTLSGLTTVNSTYLLDTKRIRKILKFYDEVIGSNLVGKEKEDKRQRFLEDIRVDIFQLVHQEKFGKKRREKFEKELKKII